MKCLYSKLGIEYQQAYSGPYADLSYFNEGARMIISIADGVLTGFGRPVVTFGDTKKLISQFKKLYHTSKGIWYMDYLEDGISEISKFLLLEGHKAKPFYTQVIDLRKNIDELHADMRKSYQNLANKYDAVISNKIERLKELHLEVVGKSTRNDKTWEIQQEMVNSGEAFIVHEPDWQAAGLFICGHNTCYYGVGKSKEVSHPVIWKAIQHAKGMGFVEFEMGQQMFNESKEASISYFKRGFGGVTKVRLEFENSNFNCISPER